MIITNLKQSHSRVRNYSVVSNHFFLEKNNISTEDTDEMKFASEEEIEPTLILDEVEATLPTQVLPGKTQKKKKNKRNEGKREG